MPVQNQISLTTSINGLTNKKFSLNDLIQMFQAREFFNNPDVVTPVNQLMVDENLNVRIPELGSFSLTDWSKSQLSSLLGIRFNKWFENSKPEDKVFELNRRFARARGEVKLRTTIMGAEENSNEGTLRAILSPSFGSVRDSAVAEFLYGTLKQTEPNLKVIRANVTTRSSSFVIGVGEPIVPGGNSLIGTIYSGIHVQNSGVGFSSLSMSLHLTRLVCTNGMTVPIHDAEILRRRHTSKLSIDSIQMESQERILEIPEKFQRACKILELSRDIPVANPEETIKGILRESHLSTKLVFPLLSSVDEETQKSSFGIAQAITDSKTLQELQVRPEDKHRLESAAGKYLQKLTNIN